MILIATVQRKGVIAKNRLLLIIDMLFITFNYYCLLLIVIGTCNNHSLLGEAKKQQNPTSYHHDVWNHIDMGPPDTILGIAAAYRECTNPDKVNVCVGAYRDENGQPWILPSVKLAEEQLINDPLYNLEYLPIEGDSEFIKYAIQFAYGKNNINIINNNIAAVQTLSGTGACRIGGQFLSDFYLGSKQVYIPIPTWGNHFKIFEACGLETRTYRYYDYTTNELNINGMIEDIQNAPDGSIILLHACAHNPTGCDPTIEQWNAIMKIIQRKKHLVFFDSAYQGFATGDSEQDAYAFRMFVNAGNIPILLAQSFAKNFGLYGERCGTLSIVCSDEQQALIIKSRLQNIIRPMYSSPPKHGSSIIKAILKDEQLTKQYITECKLMADRIASMRQALVDKLIEIGSKHDWSHISTKQIGMFAFTGMTCDMVDLLTSKYSIYMTRDGRISLAGLNPSNIEYVAKAIHTVTDGKSITSSTTN